MVTDITGKTYGRLTAQFLVGKDKRNRPIWRFLCECGRSVDILRESVRSGRTRSCGCLRKQNAAKLFTTHGLSNHFLYNTWCGMNARCYDHNAAEYNNYGGRGIRVCERWSKNNEKGLENFIADMSQGYQEGLTLDRIDCDGDYEIENCRWANQGMQSRNRRKKAGCYSEYVGVTWHKLNKKWVAQIKIEGAYIHLGLFPDEISAARAYDDMYCTLEGFVGVRPNGTAECAAGKETNSI